ncbi:MAG TPA: carboxypeptidase-like regulatory domain-containing protein, partial [Streptosporangiaceae bacterium]|nr:carboxypeptidase-like regulatory domain-containing protein [Streptosporangiaceae bacterium]
GKPAYGTCVEAQDLTDQYFSDLFFTTKGGHYSINGLSSGRYALTFSACFTDSPNLASITLPSQVHITAPHPVTGLDVSLAAGGTIRGTVTGQSSPSSPAGPQDQACVVALPTNPDGSDQIVFTNAAGQYRLDGLAAGTYRVELGDPFCANDLGVSDLAPQWYRDQLTEAGGSLVTVTAGHTIGMVNATLRPLGGIDGTVTTAAHTGVTGECVTAVPFHASADLLAGPPSADVAITASGHFRLIDLPAGQYKIEFSVGCGGSGYVTQWWDGTASAGSAKVVTVGGGTVTGIDATLRR